MAAVGEDAAPVASAVSLGTTWLGDFAIKGDRGPVVEGQRGLANGRVTPNLEATPSWTGSPSRVMAVPSRKGSAD